MNTHDTMIVGVSHVQIVAGDRQSAGFEDGNLAVWS
jgi:hypothetical protein